MDIPGVDASLPVWRNIKVKAGIMPYACKICIKQPLQGSGFFIRMPEPSRTDGNIDFSRTKGQPVGIHNIG